MWNVEQLAQGIKPKLFFAKEHSQLFYQPICQVWIAASAYPATLPNKDSVDAKALGRINLSEVYLLSKQTCPEYKNLLSQVMWALPTVQAQLE